MLEALYRFTREVTYHALTFNGQVICEAQVGPQGSQTMLPYTSGFNTREDLVAHEYVIMDNLSFILTIQAMLNYWIQHTS